MDAKPFSAVRAAAGFGGFSGRTIGDFFLFRIWFGNLCVFDDVFLSGKSGWVLFVELKVSHENLLNYSRGVRIVLSGYYILIRLAETKVFYLFFWCVIP